MTGRLRVLFGRHCIFWILKRLSVIRRGYLFAFPIVVVLIDSCCHRRAIGGSLKLPTPS